MKRLAVITIVTMGFVFSGPRLAAANCTDAQWLDATFLHALARHPTPDENTYFLQQLQQGTDRAVVALAIISTYEYLCDYLGGSADECAPNKGRGALAPFPGQGVFQTLFFRGPSPQELAGLVGTFPKPQDQARPTDENIIGILVSSNFNEYAAAKVPQNVCDLNGAVIQALFNDLVARNAVNAELGFFENLIQNGLGWLEIAWGITQVNDLNAHETAGVEYVTGVVHAGYLRFEGRDATPNELTKWVPLFLPVDGSVGITDEVFYAVLAGDYACTPEVHAFPNVITPPPNLPILAEMNQIALPPVEIAPGPPPPLNFFTAITAATSSMQAQLTVQQQTIVELQRTIAQQQATIAQQQATIAQQLEQLTVAESLLAIANNSVIDLVNTLFGLAPTQDVAQAAANDAQIKIAVASVSPGSNTTLLDVARADFDRGTSALGAADYTTAVKRYRLAYLEAGNAMR